jgi:hypothetical protein
VKGFGVPCFRSKQTEEAERQLKEVREERFRMYAWRDHCGRPSSEEESAGARFNEKGGKVLVSGALIEQVEMRNGRLDAHWFGGAWRALGWSKQKGDELNTRIETKPESITFKRKSFDGRWILVDVKMKDVFEDWGPEHIPLEDVRIVRQ